MPPLDPTQIPAETNQQNNTGSAPVSNLIMQTPPSSGSKLKVVSIILILLIILAAAAIYAKYLLFPSDPQQIVDRSLKEFVTSKSFSFVSSTVSTSTEFFGDETISTVLTSKISGVVDIANLFKDPKFSLKIDGTSSGDSMSVAFGAQISAVGKRIYVLPEKIPLFGAILANTLKKNQWVEIDFASAKENSAYPEASEVFQRFVEKGTFYKLIGIFGENGIIKVDSQLPNEKINGQTAYHFVGSINKEAIATLMDKVVTILKSDGLLEDFDEAEFIAAKEEFNKILESQETKQMDIWINKSTGRIMKVAQQIDNEIDETKISMAVVTEWSDFNEPVNVLVPESVITLNDLFESLEF